MKDTNKIFATIQEFVLPEISRWTENGKKPLSVSTLNINKDMYKTYTACLKKDFWDEQQKRAQNFQMSTITYINTSLILFGLIADGKLTVSEKPADTGKENPAADIKNELKKLNEKFDFMTTLLGGKISLSRAESSD